MLSKVFPMDHPKAGKPTDFKTKQKDGSKKHTIRGNVELWEHRAKEVNAGRAVLSLRQWSGKPYEKGSHQIEIARLTEIYTQRITMRWSLSPFTLPTVYVQNPGEEAKYLNIGTVAANDGLSLEDFMSWFKIQKYGQPYHGIVIHFTPMLY